jgi:hypothetical protein
MALYLLSRIRLHDVVLYADSYVEEKLLVCDVV